MNIALGALIITIILFPGALCLKAYYSSFNQKDKTLHVSFAELLFQGLVISFVYHFAAIALMALGGITVDYKLIYQIVVADKIQLENVDFTKSFLQFGLYNILVNVASFSLTKWAKLYILNENLDLRYEGLKTANYWFLIFSARYLDRAKKGRREKTDLIWVDIMATGSVVYSGFLFDFEYSPNKDALETITLKNAAKRTYIKTKSNEPGSHESEHILKLGDPRDIQGDAFLILAKDILNINLYYLNVEFTKEVNPPEPKEQLAASGNPQ